jgi:hypothetical protein
MASSKAKGPERGSRFGPKCPFAGRKNRGETVRKRHEITVSRRVLINKRRVLVSKRRVLVNKRRVLVSKRRVLVSKRRELVSKRRELVNKRREITVSLLKSSHFSTKVDGNLTVESCQDIGGQVGVDFTDRINERQGGAGLAGPSFLFDNRFRFDMHRAGGVLHGKNRNRLPDDLQTFRHA